MAALLHLFLALVDNPRALRTLKTNTAHSTITLAETALGNPPPLTFDEYMARRNLKLPSPQPETNNARALFQQGKAALALRQHKQRALDGYTSIARRQSKVNDLPFALRRLKISQLLQEGASRIALREERISSLPQAIAGIRFVELAHACERSMRELHLVRLEASRRIKLVQLEREGRRRYEWLAQRSKSTRSASKAWGPPPSGFEWADTVY